MSAAGGPTSSTTSSAAQPAASAARLAAGVAKQGVLASSDSKSHQQSLDAQSASSITRRGPGVTEAGMQAATLHGDTGASTGLPAGSIPASSDSSNRQSHDIASVRSSASEAFTQQPAARQPAFAPDPLHVQSPSLPEAHATFLSNVAAPAAAGLQADGAKGSADFVLTAADTEGKQQVMEKVYLASPQVLAGLATSTSAPSNAGHDAPQLNKAAATAKAISAAADTVMDKIDPKAVSLAVSKAPASASSPALAGGHFPSVTSTSTTAASSPDVGLVAKDGLARRQDEHALGSKIGFSWSEQLQSSFQTLPFADPVGSHSNVLPLSAGISLCDCIVFNSRQVGSAYHDLFLVQLIGALGCALVWLQTHMLCHRGEYQLVRQLHCVGLAQCICHLGHDVHWVSEQLQQAAGLASKPTTLDDTMQLANQTRHDVH